MTIGLVKRINSEVGDLEEERTLVIQIESNKYELSKGTIIPISNFMATLPKPIKAPRDIAHVLKDPNFHLLKNATHEQYDKNHKLLLLSAPFPIHQVPSNNKVLRPVLASTVKIDPAEPDLYDLRAQMHANGAS